MTLKSRIGRYDRKLPVQFHPQAIPRFNLLRAWDFTVVDLKSKFIIEGQVGARTAELTKVLLVNARERLTNL